MDKDFLFFLQGQPGKKQNTTVIMPFHDNHIGIPDDTLYYGLPFLIYDMFSDKNPGILHPYLSVEAVESLNIKGEGLTQKDNLKKVAERLSAKTVIFGSFQRSLHDTIRIIVNIYNTKTDTVLSPAVEFSTDFNDSVFVQLQNAILKAFDLSKAVSKPTKTSYPFPSMQTFRYYSKGLSYASRYNQGLLEVAALWFEKALKESYQKYDDAALHLARVHLMTALIQRLNQIDSSQERQKAELALQFVASTPQKLTPKFLLTLRYGDAQTAFIRGFTAWQGGKTKEAASFAAEGLDFVPEDGLLQNLYLLSKGSDTYDGFALKNAVCF